MMEEFWWAAKLCKQLEETISADEVEGFREIDKGKIAGSPLLPGGSGPLMSLVVSGGSK